MKASALVGCLTLANEIPFMTTVGCGEEQLWIQLITGSLHDVERCSQSGRLVPLARSNLLNRPLRVLCNQSLLIGCSAFERRNVGYAACITQGDTHIAQKPATLDPFDW